jgi:penicillin G amidase
MATLDKFIGSIAAGGLTWLSRRRLPLIDGSLTLPGVSAQVEIIRDRWGIPHIYATDLSDLFFAQGFVHAQDRLFQMEMNRRMAQGRLSELFGSIALDTDRSARTFGFNRLGRADWANAGEDLRNIILAYTAGVNAYLNHPGGKMPVEFTLLNHHPEPWTPEDTTAFTRVMIWQLSHAWYGEIIRAQITEAVGEAHAAELDIHYPMSNPITLPHGIEYNQLDLEDVLRKVGGPFLDQGKGSNAWAVTGQKSTTGNPVLCNDMHLQLLLPSLWYEVHLVAGDFNVIGVSLPGVPMVLVGHNAHVAWGITLAFTDCEDLFIEELNPQNSSQYQFKGNWLEAEVIPEPIKIKGKPDAHIEKVFVTQHGPIISDVVGHPEQKLAVNSMALRPNTATQGWLLLDQAQNWEDFVAAMHLIEAPQLNVCYADIDGNIGYWVTGKVPVRAKGDGTLPSPGWTGEYEWVSEVPFETMPHAFNPAQGYVVTCNNRIIPNDYPYFLGNVWMNGYRARRIVDYLESKDQLSMDDHRAIHMDFTCLPGKQFLAHLEGLTSTDEDVQLALTRLRSWDGQLSASSTVGTIYEVVRYYLVRNLLEPGLGKALTLRYMGEGFHPLLFPTHEFYGHDTVAVFNMLDNPDSWWLGQAGGKHAVLTQSIKQAVGWLKTNLGDDPETWQWGKLHRVIFSHPMALQKPLDRVFNLGPFPIGGDTDTPCQTAFFAHDPYDNKAWAPSYRQIVDMGNLENSVAMFPPGQSGQLGSPHYGDLAKPWLNGEYHPMLWTRDQVESQAEGKLVLKSGV